jgi:outer membrane protein assembly factor BamB
MACETRIHELSVSVRPVSAHYLALLFSGLALASLPRAAWSAESPTNERATAARFEAGKPDLYQAKGAYVRLEVVLEHAQGEGRPLSLFIHGAGEGRFTTGWIQGLHWQTNLPYGLVAEGLRIEGDRLAGGVRGDHHCQEMQFTLTGQIKDGRITGTYAGHLMVQNPRARSVSRQERSGNLNGRLRTQADLDKENVIAAGRDYPCHRGPIGSGAAVDCGRELVQSFSDAKLVWKSEENMVPGAWGCFKEDSNYGGVAVADGRIYAYYTCPVKVPADAAATNAAPESTNAPPHLAWTKREDGVSILSEATPLVDPASMWTPSDPYRGPLRRIKTLDRILCLDAATGRTLWRASWPAVGFCLKAANHSTPCVADGVVVVQSGMYMIYALDAATGAMRWSNADTFAASENFKNLRDSPEKVQARPVNQVSPLAADGVVMVLGLGKGGSALGLGLEVATGKVLWKAPGASPRQLWVHGGKTYFLSRTAAFEPKTGKVLWTLGDQKSRQDITVACEDYAVTQGGEQLRCYRITPEKAEQIWVLPWKGSTYMDGPVIHRDHLYAIGHFTDGRDQKKNSDGKPVGCLWCIQLPTGTVVGVQVGSDSPEMLAAEGLILDQHYKSAWRAAPGAFELLSKPSGGHQQDQRFLCPAAGWAPAAIADGRYFARLDMYCMGLACWDLRDRGVPATPAAGTR